MSLSKMKMGSSLNVDKISEMPQNITENILSRLPINEAVRTCILSKRWRYNWVTLPELIFDFSLGHALINQNDKLVSFINGVLALHKGPICKFELYRLCIQNSSDIDNWMRCLSRNGIQELILCMPQVEHYELPSCLYSCEKLNHLELSFCTLRHPPSVASFRLLKSLLLYKVECNGFTFGNLVSRCPLLERLKIDGFTGSNELVIYAPKLKDLVITGFCHITQNICFKNTPVLACVSLYLQCHGFNPNLLLNHNKNGERENPRLIKVFGCLVGVEKLTVGGNFLKFLAVGFVPKRLPDSYHHLKRLELEICFNDLHMISMALCLIRSAPNLQKLKIDAVTQTITASEFSKVQDGLEFSLNQLQNVKISSFSGLRSQLEFVKFLFSITPALETMSILGFKRTAPWGHPMHGSRMLEKLIGFPQVSTKAKIEYYESGELVELGN